MPDDLHDAYRRVLKMRDAGVGLAAIAAIFSSEGVPTSRGGTWHASTVKRIATSELAKRLRAAAARAGVARCFCRCATGKTRDAFTVVAAAAIESQPGRA